MSECSVMAGSGLEERIFESLKSLEPIPELSFRPTARYSVATEEEILYQLIEDNDLANVSGAFFGDEGKGKIVDMICRYFSSKFGRGMVIRANSGSNAGHTVVIRGKKHTFHLCPSGIMVPNITNYIGPECVMDPVEFMQKEVSILIDGGVDYKNKLFVGNVHIVTPYHRLMDIMRNLGEIPEDISMIKLANVSTMEGIAPVHASKVMKEGPRLDDLFGEEKELRRILEKDMKAYNGMLFTKGIDEDKLLRICEERLNKDIKRVPDYILNFLKAEDKVQYLVDLFKKEVSTNELFPKMKNVKYEVKQRLRNCEKACIENAQAYFLSNNEGTHWGSSTSADTRAIGAMASLGLNPKRYRCVVLNIHKAPDPSRVGRGSNTSGYAPQTFFSDKGFDTLEDFGERCVAFDAIQKQFWNSVRENGILEPTVYEDKTGKYLINVAMAISSSRERGECGATTRKPRMLGIFDCVAHAKVMEEQGPYTSISAVDRGDICDKVGVVVAYVFYNPDNKTVNSEGTLYKNGMLIKPGEPYPNERVLKYCHPIIKVIDGWKDTPIAAGKWDGKTLPRGVQEFIGTIKHFTGAEIIAIGNGTEFDNLIYIKRDADKV